MKCHVQIYKSIPPEPFYVAVSGGIDSMFALYYLNQFKQNKITIAHFNHGTEWANSAEQFVRKYAADNNIPIIVGSFKDTLRPLKTEMEFRTYRYNFLHSLNAPVILGHHLNDAVETYLFNTIRNGSIHTIPYNNLNCIRPFITTEREIITSFASLHNIPFVDDPSNNDVNYTRNMIRHEMMQYVYKINPGIKKMIKKKLLAL